MSRVFVVARTEFLTLVKTKAFLIGILMLPLMIGASVVFQVFAAKHVDADDHAFAVIDDTGVLYATIAKAAEEHNKEAGSGSAQRCRCTPTAARTWRSSRSPRAPRGATTSRSS